MQSKILQLYICHTISIVSWLVFHPPPGRPMSPQITRKWKGEFLEHVCMALESHSDGRLAGIEPVAVMHLHKSEFGMPVVPWVCANNYDLQLPPSLNCTFLFFSLM